MCKLRYRRNLVRRLLALTVAVVAVGCATSSPANRKTHELLHATLWVQHSAEYRALALQAFNLARLRMDEALRDPTWTASLEQSPGHESLPPAVIVDVDDTVLDNSYYEARLIRDGAFYGPDNWDPWVREAAAPAVPGALQFCQEADAKGVTVFYVTNRRSHLREPTRRNLEALGFPLDPDRETVLTRDTADKTNRRMAIASSHRILLLVGDNNGDFASDFVVDTNRERREATDRHRERWGREWIVIPNPMYGKWEAVIVQDWSSPDEERLRRKYGALDVAPGAIR